MLIVRYSQSLLFYKTHSSIYTYLNPTVVEHQVEVLESTNEDALVRLNHAFVGTFYLHIVQFGKTVPLEAHPGHVSVGLQCI